MKLTTHLSTPWGWKAEMALLADLQFTHINGYPSAAGPVQTSESSPIRDWHSTTELPNQLWQLQVQVTISLVDIALPAGKNDSAFLLEDSLCFLLRTLFVFTFAQRSNHNLFICEASKRCELQLVHFTRLGCMWSRPSLRPIFLLFTERWKLLIPCL